MGSGMAWATPMGRRRRQSETPLGARVLEQAEPLKGIFDFQRLGFEAVCADVHLHQPPRHLPPLRGGSHQLAID
jgi:hypothetical protein